MTGRLSEFQLIDRIRQATGPHERVQVGIGDDCALLRFTPGRPILATADMLMDGRHFRLEQAGGFAVGYKAMAVNISDIAAMAGVPIAAIVSVALPKAAGGGPDEALALELMNGLRAAADEYEVALAGGDTNGWDGPLVINVTLLGEAPAEGAVLRSGASIGEAICVTGPLGGSLLRRHLRPVPRVREALVLRREFRIGGMIDISDGLLADLNHILEESGGLGAELEEGAIPIHPDAIAMSRQDGKSAFEHACGDGEDFELCLTLPADQVELAQRLVPGLAPIGWIVQEPGLRIRNSRGEMVRVESRGFDHFSS